MEEGVLLGLQALTTLPESPLRCSEKMGKTPVLSVTSQGPLRKQPPTPCPGPALLASTADLGRVSSYLLNEAGRRGGPRLGGQELSPSVSPSAWPSRVCADIR